MHSCITLKTLLVAAAMALQVGCSSLTYEQIPGPPQEARQELAASTRRACEVLPEAAASLSLIVETMVPGADGCMADLRRDAPWWLPGDDGVRLRVRVVPVSAGQPERSLVVLAAKRVALGQVWIDTGGHSFITRLGDLAGTGR